MPERMFEGRKFGLNNVYIIVCYTYYTLYINYVIVYHI